MNKLSGLGITMIFLGVWMAIWSSPKNYMMGLWISILLVIFGGMVLMISLPME